MKTSRCDPYLDHIGSIGDIYLEYQGKKVAVVQSYTAQSINGGQDGYRLTLYHVYATDDAITEDIDLFMLSDFDMAVCKWDRQIVYRGCRLVEKDDIYSSGGMIAERIGAIARERIEIPAL